MKPAIQKFLDVGYNSLIEGIKQAKPGNYINDISQAIEKVINAGRYGIVRNFTGHGIGRKVHEGPPIPNFGQRDSGPLIVEDMVICIEPILTMDLTGKINHEGKWNTKTAQGTYACHFEHMVHVTKDGPKVLTKRTNETF